MTCRLLPMSSSDCFLWAKMFLAWFQRCSSPLLLWGCSSRYRFSPRFVPASRRRVGPCRTHTNGWGRIAKTSLTLSRRCRQAGVRLPKTSRPQSCRAAFFLCAGWQQQSRKGPPERVGRHSPKNLRYRALKRSKKMINVLDTWRAKRRIRKTHQELYSLSDRTLSDIGLARSDIRTIGANGLPNRHGR